MVEHDYQIQVCGTLAKKTLTGICGSKCLSCNKLRTWSMESSSLSKIISVGKMLKSITDKKDLVEFKQCLMNELNIEEYNESMLFSKILLLIYKQVTPISIDNIKTKMTGIHEKIKSRNLNCSKTISGINLSSSSQCNTTDDIDSMIKINYFSLLSSDCIDYLSTFLSKKESILFGYLNCNLYIETQKRSYLLKRKTKEMLIIDESKFDSKSVKHKINNFAFSVPTELVLFGQNNGNLDWSLNNCKEKKKTQNVTKNENTNKNKNKNKNQNNDNDENQTKNGNRKENNVNIGYDDDNENEQLFAQDSLKIVKSWWFESLFTRLDRLECHDSKYLPFIPINLLFNKNKNNQNKNKHPISLLYIKLKGLNKLVIEQNVQCFISNYQSYFQDSCQSNNDIIRNVEMVRIGSQVDGDLWSIVNAYGINIEENNDDDSNDDDDDVNYKIEVGRILSGLNKNYISLWIACCGILNIVTLEQLFTIFHSNLRYLCLGNELDIKFNNLRQIKNAYNNGLNGNNNNTNNDGNVCCKLDEIRFEIASTTDKHDKDTKRFMIGIKNLDYFKLRSNVESITIAYKFLSWRFGRRFYLESQFFAKNYSKRVLDKLLLSKYTPNLHHIIFELDNDNRDLHQTSKCFNYLIENRKRLMNNCNDHDNKKNRKHIESISFVWKFDERLELTFSTTTRISLVTNRNEIPFDELNYGDWSSDSDCSDNDMDKDKNKNKNNKESDDDDDDGSDGTVGAGGTGRRVPFAEFPIDWKGVVVQQCQLTPNDMSGLFTQVLDWFSRIIQAKKHFPRRVTLNLS